MAPGKLNKIPETGDGAAGTKGKSWPIYNERATVCIYIYVCVYRERKWLDKLTGGLEVRENVGMDDPRYLTG